MALEGARSETGSVGRGEWRLTPIMSSSLVEGIECGTFTSSGTGESPARCGYVDDSPDGEIDVCTDGRVNRFLVAVLNGFKRCDQRVLTGRSFSE